MLLANNGLGSSEKRTHHINLRYFFVTNQIPNKELRVEYCPIGDMIADIFTKPLQGTLFPRLRNSLLKVPSDYGLSSIQANGDMSDRPQECVGEE